jgi:purine-binding chemotaxis protein CheW
MEAFMDESGIRTGNAADMKQLISFTVGAEEYGLELLRVKEVIRMRSITWLPQAPSCMKGIINLRGDVIPIVDLRDRFGLQSQEHTAKTRVVVVEVEGRPVGIVVDSASQVMHVPADQFDPPPSVMGVGSGDFITAIGKTDEKLVIMLDLNRIFSTEELSKMASCIKAA